MGAEECKQPEQERRFAARMKATRKHRKVTQAELAQRINLPRMAVCCIEAGTRRIALGEAAAIAAALGVPLVDLLGTGPLVVKTETRVA